MNKKLLKFLSISTFSLMWITFSFAQVDGEPADYSYYFDKYDIEVVHNAAVEIEYPVWARPNPAQDITDLSYWVNDVLPYEEDKDEDAYLVYPKHGIIVPVVRPDSTDQALIDRGEMFDHYNYLEEGALHYFWYSPDVAISNMVIAAHSSFKKDSAGDYKTIFQVLPISREWDKIFYYKKNSSWSYDMYEYTITESYETDKYDVGILGYDGSSTPTLTTYGCYKIWSNEDRWINVAKMTSEHLDHSSLNQPPQQVTYEFEAEHSAAEEQVLPALDETEKATDDTKKKLSMTLRERLALRQSSTHSTAPVKAGRTYELPFIITYGNRLEQLAVHLIGKGKFKQAYIQALIEKIEAKIEAYESEDEPNEHKIDMYSYLLEKVQKYLD